MEHYENENMLSQPEAAPEAPSFVPPAQQEIPPQFSPEQREFIPPVQQPAYSSPVQQPVYTQPVQSEQPVQQKAKKERKDPTGWKIALCTVLIIALVAGGCFSTAWMLGVHYDRQLAQTQAALNDRITQLEQRLEAQSDKHTGSTGQNSGTVQTPIVTAPAGDYLTPAQVYQQNLASVVLINNVVQNGFYSGGGTGSGFVLSSDGYVVTNYHVVEGGGKLSVVLYDGTEYAAKLVGYDNANDVALLKVEAEGLQPVVVGDSDALIVGDQVAAIGNPLGELTSTMTVGYVSAKERDVNTSGFAINMIQTDAAINSGNSGGPLFNMYGQVVGITSAKYSGSSSSGATIEGIGFAIPINDVLSLLNDLMTNGYDTGPYLGISVKDMDAESASYFNLPMGAYVSEVVRGSCAEAAGMNAKDIIINLGGHEVGSVNELSRALRNFKAGDTVDVTVVRGGREVKLTITLDQKPQQTETAVVPGQQEQSGQDDWFGNLVPGFGG